MVQFVSSWRTLRAANPRHRRRRFDVGARIHGIDQIMIGNDSGIIFGKRPAMAKSVKKNLSRQGIRSASDRSVRGRGRTHYKGLLHFDQSRWGNLRRVWAQKFWIERDKGKLCFMLSARDLDIKWGDDNRYWNWISQNDSCCEEIAELIAVCWLEVKGQFDCKLLSPGTAYAISFRLKLHEPPCGICHIVVRAFNPTFYQAYGWNCKPVKFSVTTPNGDHKIYARYLSDIDKPVENEGYQMTPLRHVEEGWMEFDAGRFVVEEGDTPGKIEFCMSEWEGGNWKGGLLLEGVKIQPVSLGKEIIE